MFSIDDGLEATGEVFLVNKEHYMLTNSRFYVEPTGLKQHLPDVNIESKFNERKGRKEVIDYRGKKVMSAFEVFEFLGKEWLIISKIDEDEVLSNYYRVNKASLYPEIVPYFIQNSDNQEYFYEGKVKNVDMDEFIRTDTTATLFTQGVSTCTSLIISYSGKFSYMAHISPYDYIYGKNRTDLVNHVFKQMIRFDITEAEKDNLRFYIISTQMKSYENLIDLILENGYLLSQIKIIARPEAEYANIYHLTKTNEVIVN